MTDNLILNDKKSTKFSLLRHHVAEALEKYFAHLDGAIPSNLYELVLRECELPVLETILNYVDGNQSKAAQILGLSRGTLCKKLKHYQLIKRSFKTRVKNNKKTSNK